MYLHIITDEKFIDSAWSAFEKASPSNNRFVIIGEKETTTYIKSFTPDFVPLHEALSSAFIESMVRYELVFIHYLSNVSRLLIFLSKPDTKFVWIGFGHDYYYLICDRKSLLLPETKKNLASGFRKPLNFIGATFSNFKHSVLLAIKNKAHLFFLIHKKMQLRGITENSFKETEVMRRIAFFSPVITTEFNLIKTNHPHFTPKLARWNYAVVSNLIDTMKQPKITTPKYPRIVVGNNATPENNHLDTFIWLKNIGYNGDIVCPLSYGSKEYASLVKQQGRYLFGDRFTSIDHFIPINEYFDFLTESACLLMNNLRQQGLGNIIMALYGGANVVMRKDNPVYIDLQTKGIHVSTIEETSHTDALMTPSPHIVENQQIIRELYNKEQHHIMTLTFIETCLKN
jgi:hypothetical protein